MPNPLIRFIDAFLTTFAPPKRPIADFRPHALEQNSTAARPNRVPGRALRRLPPGLL